MRQIMFMVVEIPVRVCNFSRELDVTFGFGARYMRSKKKDYSYGKVLHGVLGNPGGYRLS